MNEIESKENQIIHGVIWKQLLLFFFPIVLGTFFQQIYNTADAIVVGRFVGTEALAAVGGSTSQIINLIVGFFVGLSSGATVVISQYYGAHDRENLSKALHTAFAFSLVGSVVITAVGLICSPILLRVMNTTEEVIGPSATYLRIYFGGILFVFIYNIGSSILRAVGDSRRPLYYLIVCCIINIVLDIVLVVGLGMGVAGAAIATVFAQGVSAVLVVMALCRSTDLFRLEIRKIRFHREALELLIKIGLPAGLQSVMYSFSNVIIQTALNAFGTNTMAAWTACGKIDSFFWMVINAFGISITTFVGQNYGARKFGRMRKSVRICIAMAVGASISISAIFILFGRYVYQLFTTDAAVVEIGMHMITMMAPAYAIYVFIEIYSGALRGTGDVLVPMLMTCGGVCVLRILWMMFVVPLKPVIDTIIYSYPISWTLTALMFIFYYRKKCAQIPDTDE
ncbi:MAG: MATE family efflux transporter [Negativibacillus sp.]|nr:MATE family efflux transporter [Negativibacillus sp.]